MNVEITFLIKSFLFTFRVIKKETFLDNEKPTEEGKKTCNVTFSALKKSRTITVKFLVLIIY
jgi:hypothetical protein